MEMKNRINMIEHYKINEENKQKELEQIQKFRRDI